MLGIGEYDVFTGPRGGSSITLQPDFTSVSFDRSLNGWATCSISIPIAGVEGSGCCEVFDGTEPWRDEIRVMRNGDEVFVGPVIGVKMTDGGGTIQARDLSYWFEKRWIEEDVKVTGDVADIFRRVFDIAYNPDDSPNISLHTRETGVTGVRIYEAAKTQRAGDAFRELSRTALDYVTIGREILAGDVREMVSTSPFIVHSQGLVSIEADKDGERLFTDVIVFGSADTTPEARVSNGRATRNADYYGLLQESFAELLINDNESARQNAASRLDQMQPVPQRYQVVFAPEADPAFADLIPGRDVQMRVGGGDDCIEVNEDMLLESISVNVSVSDNAQTETISGNIVPIGEPVGELQIA